VISSSKGTFSDRAQRELGEGGSGEHKQAAHPAQERAEHKIPSARGPGQEQQRPTGQA